MDAFVFRLVSTGRPSGVDDSRPRRGLPRVLDPKRVKGVAPQKSGSFRSVDRQNAILIQRCSDPELEFQIDPKSGPSITPKLAAGKDTTYLGGIQVT